MSRNQHSLVCSCQWTSFELCGRYNWFTDVVKEVFQCSHWKCNM